MSHEALKNGLQTRINIHLPVRGDLYHHCVELNKAVLELGKREISFAPTSLHIPHVTMYMADVDSSDTLKKVLTRVASITEHIRPFRVGAGRVYLSSRQYLFMEVGPDPRLNELTAKLKKSVDECATLLDWDVASSAHHVTLGYAGDDSPDMRSLCTDVPGKMGFACEALEVSFCARRGTCVGTIKSFEFRSG